MSYSTPANIQPPRLASVYENQVAITPTDNTAIGPFAGLYSGSGGTIVVCPRNSATVVTYVSVPAGVILPIAIQGVNATGTTATGLVGVG